MACFLCVLNWKGIYDFPHQIFRNKYFGVSSMILKSYYEWFMLPVWMMEKINKNVIADERNSEECYCLQYRSVLVGWSVDFTKKPSV